MILEVALGILLTVFTVIIHALCTLHVLRMIETDSIRTWAPHSHFTRMASVATLVVVLLLAALLESASWAVAFFSMGAFDNFESAMYFSMVTFTTLGYGDLTPAEGWRLLAGLEAACGIIMFAWSTALLIALMNRLISSSSPSQSPP